MNVTTLGRADLNKRGQFSARSIKVMMLSVKASSSGVAASGVKTLRESFSYISFTKHNKVHSLYYLEHMRHQSAQGFLTARISLQDVSDHSFKGGNTNLDKKKMLLAYA
jgi:hypothetical protein